MGWLPCQLKWSTSLVSPSPSFFLNRGGDSPFPIPIQIERKYMLGSGFEPGWPSSHLELVTKRAIALHLDSQVVIEPHKCQIKLLPVCSMMSLYCSCDPPIKNRWFICTSLSQTTFYCVVLLSNISILPSIRAIPVASRHHWTLLHGLQLHSWNQANFLVAGLVVWGSLHSSELDHI
jgi:hypothetical protein